MKYGVFRVLALTVLLGEARTPIGASSRECGSVAKLVKTGQGVRVHDRGGFSLLMVATLAEQAGAPVVSLLIEAGADVNEVEPGQSYTALHFAARDQRAPIVALLLAAGAAVDPVDRFGNTPLWRALMTKSPSLEVVRMLLAAGANPDRANRSGVSPRTLARTSPEALALFG